jgi:hypothetical protein
MMEAHLLISSKLNSKETTTFGKQRGTANFAGDRSIYDSCKQLVPSASKCRNQSICDPLSCFFCSQFSKLIDESESKTRQQDDVWPARWKKFGWTTVPSHHWCAPLDGGRVAEK